MNKDSCYAFYGSLRRGMYNHQRFQPHLQYLFTENLAGFNLYALERYPIAVKSNLISDAIMVEVFKILNCDTEAAIHQLEMNAGYYYDEVVIRGFHVGIYLFEHPRQFPLVECGDWVRYVKKTED